MLSNQALLEARLRTCEEKAKGLRSYLSELKAMCDKHQTPDEVCAEDCTEAGHNLAYYDSEIARIRQELSFARPGGLSKVLPTAGTLLPQTRNQGIGAVLLSSISFVTGALVGATLKSGKNKGR